MSDSELLDRLAADCGILVEYQDIWGRSHRVSDESKRALLRAMRLRVDTESELRAEIAERETRPWRLTLQPVHVARRPVAQVRLGVTLVERRLGAQHVAVIEGPEGERVERPFVPARTDSGERRDVDGERLARAILPLDAPPGPGTYRVRIIEPGGGVSDPLCLVLAPPRCHQPAGLQGEGRTWGPQVQLYAARSRRNWGIGDLTDLETLVRTSAEAGAGFVGVQPLHALFPRNPAHASPYSPSSRTFLNPLFLDIESLPELAESDEIRRLVRAPEFRARLVGMREAEQVDYETVARTKHEVLRPLYESFRHRHLAADTDRARAFRAFQRDRGDLLAAYATFEALGEEARRADARSWGWPVWPEAWRRPDSPDVARFAERHAARVEFHAWLQWLCDRQLGEVGRRCREARMAVGLYADLAVGVDRAGFDAWRYQDALALDVGLGAPPDDFNLQGQNWGLPPFLPDKLRELAYAPVVECLRANMRHAGALRIDHVMGLMRSFWVPPGLSGSEGSYVLYPFADLLGVLALESMRAECLVVGEDLGTVPPVVREAMGSEGILSCRVFLFMKDAEGEFAPPSDYPRQAVVSATTHDLPTLAGWWRGRDIAVRGRLGLFPEERRREEQLVLRSQDRARALFALSREGVLPRGMEVDLDAFPEMTPELATTVHRYLARTPSMLLTVQLEDVLGELDQVNLPGTSDEHPNWRRKLTLDLEDLVRDGRLAQLGRVLDRERGRRASRAAARGARGTSVVPRATYRLQLGGAMSFRAATRLVPYLSRLGVSHLYASPLFEARPGTSHGYDVVDHCRTNPDLGTPEDLERLIDELKRHGMGLVLDHVPNHVGIGSDNLWWMSVLEHGQASPFASLFDIDWQPQKDALRGKLLLPVLEDHFGVVLEGGLLRLTFHAERGELDVTYHDHRFPVDPRTYPVVLGFGLERLSGRIEDGDTAVVELRNLSSAFANLPPTDVPEDERKAERLRDATVLQARLSRLVARAPAVGEFLAENVALLNGVTGTPESYDRLASLLDAQPYRLAYWRVAADEINYRRFFDVNDLAGLRIEDLRAFDAVHGLVLDLVRRGRVDGLRIDHPDGLYDPAQYLSRLRKALEEVVPPDRPRPWIVIEKILASHERLREGWPVDGTTGYDFLAESGGLFVDGRAARTLDRTYQQFLGRSIDFERTVLDSKRLVLDTALSSELTVLSNSLDRICESDRRNRDFTWQRLQQALADVIASFPVYRTYIDADGPTAEDRRHVEWAVTRAIATGPAFDPSAYHYIRDVLLLDVPAAASASRPRLLSFVHRFQQTTGPVMAKGLEDRALYVYHRLLALNEVGCDPGRLGTSVAAFHRANAERASRWPHTLLGTSTHDTKRSEDVRSRIAALSEVPDRWRRAVARWAAIHASHKRHIDGRPAPSANDEYALYQTLLGVWPAALPDGPQLAALTERVKDAMLKSAREAKVHTSWIHPVAEYESAVADFVDAVLASCAEEPFREEFLPLARLTARIGMLNGLSQLLLKLTSPGVPDLYQGCEGLSLTLVDPDNRRAVDFSALEAELAEVERLLAGPAESLAERAAGLLDDPASGRGKTFVTVQVLRARRALADAFEAGPYEPLRAHGPRAKHVCAFSRRGSAGSAVTVAPRLFGSLSDLEAGELPVGPAVWSGTWIELRKRLTGAVLRNALTGERVAVEERDGHAAVDLARALAGFPVALLVTD